MAGERNHRPASLPSFPLSTEWAPGAETTVLLSLLFCFVQQRNLRANEDGSFRERRARCSNSMFFTNNMRISVLFRKEAKSPRNSALSPSDLRGNTETPGNSSSSILNWPTSLRCRIVSSEDPGGRECGSPVQPCGDHAVRGERKETPPRSPDTHHHALCQDGGLESHVLHRGSQFFWVSSRWIIEDHCSSFLGQKD